MSRRAAGYYEITDPDLPRGRSEADTIQCAHCNGHFEMTPKQDPVCEHGYCGRCNHFICKTCADEMDRTLTCRPFEKWLDQMEARDRLRRATERGR